MRKVREVLRLHFDGRCKHRQIAAARGVSPATVADCLDRAPRVGVSWERARVLSDAEVESTLSNYIGGSEPPPRAAIDLGWEAERRS
jgi:hypothetical protein